MNNKKPQLAERTKQGIWRQSLLLENVSEKFLLELSSRLIEVKYSKGDLLIKEGAEGTSLYFIEEGSVEVVKDGVTLAEIGPGQHFGAMALMDNTKRSASVYACSDTTVFRLSIDVLKGGGSGMYHTVLKNHMGIQQGILRNMNTAVIRETKAKLAEAENRIEAANFFVYIIFGLLCYHFILGIFIEYHSVLRHDLYTTIFNSILLVFIGGVAYYGARKSSSPLGAYGLNLNNSRRNIIQSLKWTAFFLAGTFLVKQILILTTETYAGRPLVEVYDHSQMGGFWMSMLFFLLYACLVPFQEFLARGVMQSTLSRLMENKYASITAIIISNLIFSAMHLHVDLKFALFTLIPGFFWGYMFYKQQSLLGVAISHVIIGVVTIMFTGIY